MRIKNAIQKINFEIGHKFLRPNIIGTSNEYRFYLHSCNMIDVMRKQIVDERHNEVLCTSS
jgi:hypothetical protein